jgi:Phage protein Gp19/Gp15/Gp42
VCGYLAHMYAADETVPNAVVIVTARVVARALTTSPTDPNVDSYASTRAMGSFSASNTAHVAQDVLGGGVWLTRQDKMALDAIDGIGSQTAINVPLYRLSWCPDAPDGWWLMAPAPGGSP